MSLTAEATLASAALHAGSGLRAELETRLTLAELFVGGVAAVKRDQVPGREPPRRVAHGDRVFYLLITH